MTRIPDAARVHFQAGLAALVDERDQVRLRLDELELQISQIRTILADDDRGAFKLDLSKIQLNLPARSVKEILDEAFPIGAIFKLDEAMQAIKSAGNTSQKESVTSIISRADDYVRVGRGLYQRIQIDSSNTNAPAVAEAFDEPEEKGDPHSGDSSVPARSDGDHHDHR